MSKWPYISSLRICFAEPPYFQMTVKPLFNHGVDVTELPGVAGWLDNLLAMAFEQTLVEKVAEHISHVDEILKQNTSEAAVSALGIIAEGMSISLYSEKLFQLKAEALCLLQKYEDAIQLCEKTLDFADKNFPSLSSDNNNVNRSNIKTNSNRKPWRSYILAKCYFHLGRLEKALGVLDKQNGGNDQSSESSGNWLFKNKEHGKTSVAASLFKMISLIMMIKMMGALCF